MSNKWKNKNVLITGINGFIGGNLCKSLLDQGANIIGLVRNYNQTSFLFYEKEGHHYLVPNTEGLVFKSKIYTDKNGYRVPNKKFKYS